MTDRDHKLTHYEIENSLATLLNHLSSSIDFFSGATVDPDQAKQLRNLISNAKDDLESWGRAVGHVAWLSSTHEEAAENTMDALGIISLMQGKLLTITDRLDEIDWTLRHRYDRATGEVVNVEA